MADKSKKKIVAAMSGGVDSSVAAALLKKTGFDVVGIFMKFWKEGGSAENRCCSAESEKLARLAAKKIAIPFYVVNAEKEFKKKVVGYFLKEYKRGRTPNPCVVCNKEIKFGILIDKALKMGAEFVATGHYARLREIKNQKSKITNHELLKGRNKEKDQSYFLWQLNQKQLSRILFPVGEYAKPEVRKLARKLKLPATETPESQEVCFIQNTNNDFLKRYLKIKPGNIIDMNGKILGRHQGLWFYTIGQRKGIEVPQGPYYVVSKDYKKNNLVVSKNQKDLEGRELIAENVSWISKPELPMALEVKIRYRSSSAGAEVSDCGKNKVRIVFQKPQRAITPGQSAVFYKGQELLGGGIVR